MNEKSYWSGTHAGPRASHSAYGGVVELYVIENPSGIYSTFYLRRIRRKPVAYMEGLRVTYDGLRYPLHPSGTLLETIAALGRVFSFDVSADFDPNRDALLPYIRYFDKDEQTWIV